MSSAMTTNRVAYEEDFAAWAYDQAGLLRAGDLAALDLENLAEEIESLANRERREVRSRLRVILQHLLKWKFQPERQSRGWSSTIRTQRDDLGEVLNDNPSLRSELQAFLPKAYARSRENALDETGLYRLPETCPWTIEQVMSPDFLPD